MSRIFLFSSFFHANKIFVLSSVLIGSLTFLLFFPAKNHGFVNYDDGTYIFENSHVLEGLTPGGIRWAFTTFRTGNWHPATWISHMLDVELFGNDPSGHHLVNAGIHAVNAVLVFWLLFILLTRFFGKRQNIFLWTAALGALSFALHPLRVESVAWASERKDVLSAFFGLGTLLCYFGFMRRRKAMPYVAMLVFYALCLLSKSMLVTLPFVLLLLDFRPLGRVRGLRDWSVPVFEKIPLFLMAGAVSGVTLAAQSGGGAVGSVESLPLWVRVVNAVHSYGMYLVKFVFPARLSVFYPYIHLKTVAFKIVLFAVVLTAATAAAIGLSKNRPWFTTGWLWYLGTLFPVIGIVQAGSQSMADRYTYFPFIGLSLAIAGELSHALIHRPRWKNGAVYSGLAVLACFSVITHYQLKHWKNSRSLFSHAARVTKRNFIAHYNLAKLALDGGDREKALEHLEESIRMYPSFIKGNYLLGLLRLQGGELKNGESHLKKVLAKRPNHFKANFYLGTFLIKNNRAEEALSYLLKAKKQAPNNPKTLANLAAAHIKTGRMQEARQTFETLISIEPDNANAYYNLGAILFKQQHYSEAARKLNRALELKPGMLMSHYLLYRTHMENSNPDRAAFHASWIREHDPEQAKRLGVAKPRIIETRSGIEHEQS
jgi:tetratricopeptide (TPR) repeat protein